MPPAAVCYPPLATARLTCLPMPMHPLRLPLLYLGMTALPLLKNVTSVALLEGGIVTHSSQDPRALMGCVVPF